MRYGSIVAIGAAALGLAAGADARAAEARNPVHCSIALQVSYEMVKAVEGPDTRLSRDLHGRLVWQALAAARFPKGAEAEAQADALRAEFSRDNGPVLALAEACMKRQDAHPMFQQARLEKQVRDGFDQEPLTARASMAQLTDVYRRSAAAVPASDR